MLQPQIVACDSRSPPTKAAAARDEDGVGHEEEGGGWMVLRHACDDLDLTVTAAAAPHRAHCVQRTPTMTRCSSVITGTGCNLMFEPFRPHLVVTVNLTWGRKGVLHLYQGSVVLHPAARGLETVLP